MDNATKRETIKQITDEVKDFHPLLEAVLSKLPGVSSYEYTHGQFERGADFVLERTDNALGRKTYVGVVAKAKKITSDISDVEEQIRECAEERYYKVFNKVRCPEVWVFSAQGYSERAKEKIHKRFADRLIHFFGPEDLVGLVDDYHSYFWFDLPHHLGGYFQSLMRRLQVLDENTSIVQIPGAGTIDIELDTFEQVEKAYRDKQHAGSDTRDTSFLHEAKFSSVSVLQAEMGFGKSRLTRRLAQSMCSADAYKKDHLVPIYTSFKQFVDLHNGNLDKLLHASLGESAPVLDDPKCTIVCILDGLDELNGDESTRQKRFQAVVEAAKARLNVRLVITARPTKSLEESLLLNRQARLFGIRPLSLSKMVKYLEQVCTSANLPERLYEDLRRSQLFKQLPKSPIAAGLFSNLLAQNHQEVPQSLTELYAKSLDLMLGRWEQKKYLATEKQFQTAELVAEQLAEFFIDNQLVYISEVEAIEHVRRYFEKRSLDVNQKEVIGLLFERSNVFSKDSESGTVCFRHRSFAEFLCAKRKNRQHNFKVEQVALNPAWSNVMFFYAGLRLDCSDLLSTVQALEPRSEYEEWMKIMAVPSYLLAAYQTEFTAVEDNAHRVLIDAAKLYLKVRKGETSTGLTNLSEMHLLYLFKIVIVESFSYKYFQKAFESIALHIDASDNTTEAKQYAIFFLGCAAIELEDETIFKYLLQNTPIDKLPIAVSLAIRAELEAHTNVHNSPLLRSHRARLQRFLMPQDNKSKQGAMALKNTVKELFEKPLKARQRRIGTPAGNKG